MKKVGQVIIGGLNVLGIICLLYYAVPYILHDTAILNPDAMLPMQKWEASGFTLTMGLIPLAIANLLAFLYVGKEKIKNTIRLCFFVPALVCLILVIAFWTGDQRDESAASADAEIIGGAYKPPSIDLPSSGSQETKPKSIEWDESRSQRGRFSLTPLRFGFFCFQGAKIYNFKHIAENKNCIYNPRA